MAIELRKEPNMACKAHVASGSNMVAGDAAFSV